MGIIEIENEVLRGRIANTKMIALEIRDMVNKGITDRTLQNGLIVKLNEIIKQ